MDPMSRGINYLPTKEIHHRAACYPDLLAVAIAVSKAPCLCRNAPKYTKCLGCEAKDAIDKAQQ